MASSGCAGRAYVARLKPATLPTGKGWAFAAHSFLYVFMVHGLAGTGVVDVSELFHELVERAAARQVLNPGAAVSVELDVGVAGGAVGGEFGSFCFALP